MLLNKDQTKKHQNLKFFQQFDDSIIQMKKEKEKRQKFETGAIPAANVQKGVVEESKRTPSPDSAKNQRVIESSNESNLQDKKGPRKFNKPKAIKGKNGLVSTEDMQSAAIQ